MNRRIWLFFVVLCFFSKTAYGTHSAVPPAPFSKQIEVLGQIPEHSYLLPPGDGLDINGESLPSHAQMDMTKAKRRLLEWMKDMQTATAGSIPSGFDAAILKHLEVLYPDSTERAIALDLIRKQVALFIQRNKIHMPLESPEFSGFDNLKMIYIGYGDGFEPDSDTGSALATQQAFLQDQGFLQPGTAVHVLPFHPYSSDDGFSVMDYMSVNSQVGTAEDLKNFGKAVPLMVDKVSNHASSIGLFGQLARAHKEFKFLFLMFKEVLKGEHLVARARVTPLFHRTLTAFGQFFAWGQFGADQWDLNYEPRVLAYMLAVQHHYLELGAKLIRIDAATFWGKKLKKNPCGELEITGSCKHDEKTHAYVKLMREVLNWTHPDVVLITETNVPHSENISYFSGPDEAQMVYNFPLPPVVAEALFNADNRALNTLVEKMIATVEGQEKVTFFNILGTHDGIGLSGAKEILDEQQLQQVLDYSVARGGQVSYKKQGEQEIPYELNVTYTSLLTGDNTDLSLKRIEAARFINAVLPGVSSIYMNGLLGKTNGKIVKAKRDINRSKITRTEQLALQEKPDPDSPYYRQYQIMQSNKQLIDLILAEPALGPRPPSRVLDAGTEIFAIQRGTGEQTLWCFVNLSEQPAQLNSFEDVDSGSQFVDIVSGTRYAPEDLQSLTLQPYQRLAIKILMD